MSFYIFGNYEINKNKKLLEQVDEKVFVKIVSPNFELEYNLSEKAIEERFKKLIKLVTQIKIKNIIYLARGCFSGYSYEEVLILKI